jgi:hypothetical protein
MKSIVLSIAIPIASFIVGLCIGATEYKNILTGIKWTDVAMLVVTLLGFTLAFYTYHQWLNNKKKEDSYQVAKKYLSAIDQVRGGLDELFFHYSSLCPAPGVIDESKEVTKQRIEHVNKVCHELYQSKILVQNSKREFAFWKVSLTEEFSEKHEILIKELGNVGVISGCLNNQLFRFHLNDAGNMNEVTREKAMLDSKFLLIYNIIDERIDMGFEKVFSFK